MDADRRRWTRVDAGGRGWLAADRPPLWRGSAKPTAARAVAGGRLRSLSASIRGYSDEGFDRGWTQIDADGWRWSGYRFGEEMPGQRRLGSWSLGDFVSHPRPFAVNLPSCARAVSGGAAVV